MKEQTNCLALLSLSTKTGIGMSNILGRMPYRSWEASAVSALPAMPGPLLNHLRVPHWEERMPGAGKAEERPLPGSLPACLLLLERGRKALL